MKTEQQSILERIKLARGTSEPSTEAPTGEPEAVNVSEDTPTEEVIETEVEAAADTNEEVADEVEGSEQVEVTEQPETNDDEDLYVEYKGREINLKDIDEWEQGHLRQSDYTRKTQELADSRKDFEAKQQEFTDTQSKLNEKLATLEVMIGEESLTDEQLAEMREYEPEEYIKHTEKLASRKKFLSDNKQKVESFNVESERAKLWDANPNWVADGKATDVFNDEMKLLQTYAQDHGYTNDEIAGFKANHLQTMIDAAKFRSLNTKNAVIAKKVRRAPVSTKPRAAQNSVNAQLDKASKAFKKNPTAENAVALRRIKRQLNA